MAYAEGRSRTGAEQSRSPVNSRMLVVSIGVGVISFLVTEFMHYVLVPDMGRLLERFLAEGVSGVVVALLTAKLMQVEGQRREAALLRMQVISEMNHHVRNALSAIALTTDSIQNEQCIRVIYESVERIEWTLREILLRHKPLREKQRDELHYFRPSAHQENPK